MPDRPLLLMPEGTLAARAKRNARASGPAPVSPGRQETRLGPHLEALDKAFENRRVRLHAEPGDFAPEDVLVLETAGTVEDFVKAVRVIEGFEFLAEYDEYDVEADEDFFREKDGQPIGYVGRVYLIFSNQQAFRQLRSLWRIWQEGAVFPRGQTKWRDVFSLLRDIRPWDANDRLEETGVLADWQDRVQRNDEVIPCEIELWFRADEGLRSEASERVRAQIVALGGTVVSESSISSIRYHAIAAKLPVAAVQRILSAETRGTVQLVQSERIQFVRAAGQMAVRGRAQSGPMGARLAGARPPAGDPRVALLDGLPLQQHVALAGRLTVDDPDHYEVDYSAAARVHGTAMASLIVWGDLNLQTPSPVPQPLYVRPIMRPVYPPANWHDRDPFEQVPDDVLIVDLIHRAVRRLFEAEGGRPAAAPTVSVINISVGIRDRPFDGSLSPLARLLDWLASKYGVLFVVSAGNHVEAIDTGKSWAEFEVYERDVMGAVVIDALARDTRNRKILSPAEAVNVLTVAALHDDDDLAVLHANRLDALPRGFPSPLNGQGLGFRRSVKPDLLVPGGRLHFVRPLLRNVSVLQPVRVHSAPGHETAAPGPAAGDLGHTVKGRGTSNAAALISRASAFLLPFLDGLRAGDGGAVLERVSDGLLLRTLLAHGARWGELGAQLRGVFQALDSDRLLEQLARLIGYGSIEVPDIAECAPTRVTTIAGGELNAETGAEHRFPLPLSISGKRGLRRLTITLCWLTPVNPLSHRWRQAQLWFALPTSKLKVDRVGPDWQAAQRGTLQHNVFEGESASAFLEGEDVVVLVSCRKDAPGLSAPVPYALAITLEVADSLNVDVYTEVRERLQQRLRVQAQAAR